MSAAERARPERITVYGTDHSPWVQAALLGIHERGLPHEVLAVPPCDLALRTGVRMPVVRFDAETSWRYDSGDILAFLGFTPTSEAERRALTRLFFASARERVDSIGRFFERFSRVRVDARSAPGRLLLHFARAAIPFYFCTVILMARRRTTATDDAGFVERYRYFEDRLADGSPYLAGEVPGVADLQLFGLVQMLVSIPGRALVVFERAPELKHLRAWAERMQARFADYPHLYTGALLEPHAAGPTESGALDRVSFWCGLATVVALFPISLATVLFYVARVRRLGLR